MNCVICKTGMTAPGFVTVTLTRQDSTVIFKGVPADVCDNCGEYYLSEETSRKVLEIAEKAFQNGMELEIVRFAA